MKRFIKVLVIVLCVSMFTPSIVPHFGVEQVEAAQKVKLNYTKRTIYEGDSFTLKVKGTKKKVTWSSSNKKVATVSSKGVVKGKSGGTSKKTCKITAKVGGKKYVCKVTVKVIPEEEDEDDEDSDEDTDINEGGDNSASDLEPTSDVAKNIAALKSYIQKNGYTNMNGDKVIRGKEDVYTPAIIYQKKTDTLKFLMVGNDSLQIDVDMEMSSSDNSEPMELSVTCAKGIYMTQAKTTIIPSEYFSGKEYDYTLYFKLLPLDDSSIKELANSATDLAFVQWEYVLMLHTRMSMKDIGFTAMN